MQINIEFNWANHTIINKCIIKIFYWEHQGLIFALAPSF